MTLPLATLRRGTQTVWLHDRMRAPAPAPAAPGRRAFARADDAEYFLRFWRHDSQALGELRHALQRLEPSTWVFSFTDDRVLRALASHLALGAAVAIESAPPPMPAGLPGTPAPPAVAAPPLALAMAPIKPPELPILPILEEVQIEGAEVLPEILQSLEQLDMTLGELKLAPASLEPTPSRIPDIQGALTQASTSVTGTLDGL